MSGEVEILGGGAIAVDTETVRRAATGFRDLIVELEQIGREIGTAQSILWGRDVHAPSAAASLSAYVRQQGEVVDDAEHLALALEEAAATYEIVELDIEYDAAKAAGDSDAMARISERRDALTALHPDASERAGWLRINRALLWPGDLVRLFTEIGYDVGGIIDERAAVIGGVAIGGLALGGSLASGLSRQGLLARDARLRPATDVVSVRPTTPVPVATVAPAGFAAAVKRVPGGGDARVRVEKYTMPDGAEEWAVYVAGTQDSGARTEAWDWESNIDLYGGKQSASYAATLEAMTAAGVQPGDAVHLVGFSQGAMITAHIALEGGYDVKTLVSVGSPVEADVGPETLAIGLRNTDDPVAAAAGGGHMESVGAVGSFTAERQINTPSPLPTGPSATHGIEPYSETGAMVDTSNDPRVVAAREAIFGHLADAVSVEATEYSAEKAPPIPTSPYRRPESRPTASSAAG